MSPTTLYVATAVVVDGCAGLVGALLPERRLARSRHVLIGFATGVLLGTTFLDLLPTTLRATSPGVASGVIGASLVAMAALEWALGRRPRAGLQGGRLATMLLGADAFHNAADGAAIAAAFLISTRLGLITSVAVIAHEVPEELADYVLLRNSGLSRGWTLLAMTGVQLTAAVGAALTLWAATAWTRVAPLAVAVATGTFLYIAVADLLPTLWRGPQARTDRPAAMIALLIGFAVAALESLW